MRDFDVYDLIARLRTREGRDLTGTFLTRHRLLIIQVLGLVVVSLAIVLREVGSGYTDVQFGYSCVVLGIGVILMFSTHYIRPADELASVPPFRLAVLGAVLVLLGLDRIIMPFEDDHLIAKGLLALFAAYLVFSRVRKRSR